MVVQVQAISQRDSTDIAARFLQRAAEVRERAALKIVDRIIDNSPVDTGTYIMAHVAGQGAVSEIAARSSHGKPRGQTWSQFANLARGNLYRSVSAQAIQASGEIWFRNRAIHAPYVEYGRGGKEGHLVYTDTRAAAPNLIRQAAREMGMDTR